MNAISEIEPAAPAAPTIADKIECRIDGQMIHSVQLHIEANYQGEWTVDRYKDEFPEAPLLSPYAVELIEKRKRESVPPLQANLQTEASVPSSSFEIATEAMHVLFEFGEVPAARGATGNPIPVRVFRNHGSEHITYLQQIDRSYVFDIELVKEVLVALALNKPMLVWGMHGTGKTTLIQQVCARTGRPVMRVQHTANMQESDVLGQWTVRNGATEFQLGPLAMAMLFGWTYIADEYDFAMPSVTSVYQPVLEGQPLLIKDAPPHLRKITPHPDFRFFATGNTNGTGDETGLYQGTMMQNAANYSRFGVTVEVKYMERATEIAVVRSKSNAPDDAAANIVDFAAKVRQAFAESQITMTVSPRELINAAELGMAYGGKWTKGLQLAFMNRLPRVDKQVVTELAQRIFG